MSKKKVMTWVFRGGAVVDIPLTKDATVRTKRNVTREGYESIEWSGTAPGVELVSCDPTEVVGVIVREV